MVRNIKTFADHLQELRSYLADKNMLAELVRTLQVSPSTVQQTFKVKSYGKLKGKKLLVYKAATKMRNELIELGNEIDGEDEFQR